MTLSFEEACATLGAPGAPFAFTSEIVDGLERRRFVNAPPNLRALFQMSRAGGDATFLVYEHERYSFTDVGIHIDACAAALVRDFGIRKGDRVAIAMRNYPEWIISFAAVLSIGAISVSMNSWWTADEIDFALEDCGATLLICDAERLERSLASCRRLGCGVLLVRSDTGEADVETWADHVRLGDPCPDVEVLPDDDATILYTSGTTGRPKGAVSTHDAVVHAVFSFGMRAAIDNMRKASNPQPSTDAPPPAPAAFILIVPLFHVTGCVAVMMSCFIGKAKLVIMYKWDVDKALELIEGERITNVVGVPTQGYDLVNSPRFAEFDTSSLRSVGGGGAPAPAALVDKVAKTVRTGGPSLGYGMTETNAYGPGNNGQDYLDRPTSTGRVVPIMRLDIRDEDGRSLPTGERGEIWFNGPNLIRGYWNRPDATAETIVDGWLRSGDAGRIDADGFVYVEDRIKDMILRGGENVYCAEVEGVIYEHPAVHEAAVFGIPHDRLGEEVAVAIVLRDGHQVTADELRAHVAMKLASFKVPTVVHLTGELLPRNAAGKFLKRELRDIVSGALNTTR